MRKNMCPKLQFKVFRKAEQSFCYIQVFKPERYEPKFALSQDPPLAATSYICTN